MTISDTELEMRLRDLRLRADDVPPPPSDLVERTRAAYRVERRRRARLAAAGVAAALILVGVPAAAGVLEPLAGRQQVAAPADPTRAPLSSLFDVPTRGSLAGDAEWLAGVRELAWLPPELRAELPPGTVLPDPPVADRRVTWAGEVAGGRIALVLARMPDQRLAQAWFTGPGDATPAQMSLVGAPGESTRLEPTVLQATPDRASGRTALVVVGLPGDEAEILTGRTVTANAQVMEHWEEVPMVNGAGALELDGARTPAHGLNVVITRPAESQPRSPGFSVDDGQLAAGPEPLDVADPRGLRDLVDEGVLLWAARDLVMTYGTPGGRDPRTTLLAAGPVGDGRTGTLLLGVTFPSGATGVAHAEYRVAPWSISSMTTTLSPAGTALLDQVIAMPTSDSLTVSGPTSGVLAEVYGADGTLRTTMPLVDGAGVGTLEPPGHGRVRILDARGAVVGEATLTDLPG